MPLNDESKPSERLQEKLHIEGKKARRQLTEAYCCIFISQPPFGGCSIEYTEH